MTKNCIYIKVVYFFEICLRIFFIIRALKMFFIFYFIFLFIIIINGQFCLFVISCFVVLFKIGPQPRPTCEAVFRKITVCQNLNLNPNVCWIFCSQSSASELILSVVFRYIRLKSYNFEHPKQWTSGIDQFLNKIIEFNMKKLMKREI